MICAGADNGFSGSIVFLNINTNKIEHIESYPRHSAQQLYDVFNEFKPVYTVLEEVFMSPGFKHVASTNFEVLGRYQQVLEMLDLSYDRVRAVSWRAKLKIKAKGREAQKIASIQLAKELFSEEDYLKLYTVYKHRDKEQHKLIAESRPDDNKCESALIAYYAKQIWREKNENK